MTMNKIYTFAEKAEHILTNEEYEADSQRKTGNQPGIARGKLVNKVLKQTSVMTAALAQFMANITSKEVNDSLPVDEISNIINEAIAPDIATDLNIKEGVAGKLVDAMGLAKSGFGKNIRSFGVSGNFVVPAGVYRVFVRVQGGGGGAGGSYSTNMTGGGGGGGAYVEGYVDVAPSQSIAITVGSGGTGGTPGNMGTSGGTSSFGTYLSATGGTLGTGGGGQSGSGGVGGTGSGDARSFQIPGGDGYDGQSVAAPINGVGGDSVFAHRLRTFSSAGRDALGYGGGGCACNRLVSVSGGAGKSGIVIVEW